MNLREVLKDIFLEFSKRGIPFVILRNYEDLPHSLGSKDLDILIRNSDLHESKKLLKEVSDAHGANRYLYRSWKGIYAFTFFWNSVREPYTVSLKVDLIINYENRGRRFLTSEEIIDNALHFRNFSVPSIAHEAFIDLLKPLLSGGCIKEKYMPKVKKALEQSLGQFEQLLSRSFTTGTATEIIEFLLQDRIREVEMLKTKMDRESYTKAFLRNPITFVLNAGAHYINELRRRSFVRNVSLAIIGPDGTGKSTVIAQLVRVLPTLLLSDRSSVRVFHFRPNLIPNLKVLLSCGKNKDTDEEFNNPHRAEPSGTIISLFRLFYYFTDYILGYLARVRPLLLQYKMVIFDRYFYDFIVDPARTKIRLPRFVPALLMRLVPRPALIVFLDNDEETILSRKQELSKSELSRQLHEYRSLASKYQWFYTVDSRKSIDDVVREISSVYIKRISEPLQRDLK